MQSVKMYTAYQFGLFRIVFGLYLVVHFAMLIPFAPELFSDTGVLPDPKLNPLFGLFPNLLQLALPPWATTVFLTGLALGAGLFATGYQRRWVALALWYGWACLYNRNNLIANPGLPYVGWLLLACALIPSGEAWATTPARRDWEMPRPLFWGAWLLLSVGYTISGIAKWKSPSWIDGSALSHLLVNPLARDSFFNSLLLSLPSWFLKSQTWAALAMETLFLPLALFRPTRSFAWGAMILMHLGILLVVDFADLTFGMLMIHLFTFDPAWLAGKKPGNQSIIFFDGVCGLCDRFVNFVLEVDQDGVFLLSPLQGETAKNKIPAGELKTVILFEDGQVFTRSRAVLRILSGIGGVWRLFAVFRVVPLPWRDAVYNFVAARRYRWFGQNENCRFPTPQEKARFLP